MPSKKRPKKRSNANPKWKGGKNVGGYIPASKYALKEAPDTSRIPWFPPIERKTGTDD